MDNHQGHLLCAWQAVQSSAGLALVEFQSPDQSSYDPTNISSATLSKSDATSAASAATTTPTILGLGCIAAVRAPAFP